MVVSSPSSGQSTRLFTVDATRDTVDGQPGDGLCRDEEGRCSLRAAVMEANALNAPAVIQLPAGVYTLTLMGGDDRGGDLDLKSNITLRGAGQDATILDGNNADRVLEVYGGKSATLEGLTVRGGRTDRGGGGIYNAGTLTLTNVTLSGNSARENGGGIYNERSTLTLTNVTLSGNKANQAGGGIWTNWTLRLAFSTLTGNSAASGGGLRIESGTTELRGVILSGNTANTGPECAGRLTSRGHNLIRSNASCTFTPQATDILGRDAGLAPLADNGGPVATHLPNPGSPVLNRVPAGNCINLEGRPVARDARGVARPQGGNCEIGAVERN